MRPSGSYQAEARQKSGVIPRLSLRVCLVVDRLEIFERDLRVLLCSGETGVPEQFLDGAEIRPIAQQMCGVGVAEAMGVDSGVAGRHQCVELHQTPNLAVS